MFLLRSENKYLKRLAKSGSKFHYVSIKIVDEVSKPHLDDISKFHYVSIKIYERHIKQSYIFSLNSNVVLLLLLLPRIRIPGLLPLDSNVVLLLLFGGANRKLSEKYFRFQCGSIITGNRESV